VTRGFSGDIDDLGGLDEGAVEVGFDGADTFVEGWVGRPEPAEAGTETLREKEVADGGTLGGVEGRAKGEAADLFEGAAEAGGIARELDGGGVGEKFTLARRRRLG